MLITQTASTGRIQATLYDEAEAVSFDEDRDSAIANLILARKRRFGLDSIVMMCEEPLEEVSREGSGTQIVVVGDDTEFCRAWFAGERAHAVTGTTIGPHSALAMLARRDHARLGLRPIVDVDGVTISSPAAMSGRPTRRRREPKRDEP